MLDLRGYGWMLWQGLELTILVGLGAMALALALGLLGAWGKLARGRAGRWVAGTYTTVIRGVPELLLILLVYYGVPTLIQDIAEDAGHDIIIDINPFIAGVITIGFIYGAFATEVFRGAFSPCRAGRSRRRGQSAWAARSPSAASSCRRCGASRSPASAMSGWC